MQKFPLQMLSNINIFHRLAIRYWMKNKEENGYKM